MSAHEKRYLLGWLAMPFMAVANGAIRDLTYGRVLSRDLAHSLSVIPLLLVIALWARFLSNRFPLDGRASALRVGAVWLLLTLAFEFGLGALQGLSLDAMLAEWDVSRGRLWPLVPLGTALAPELSRGFTGSRAAR